MGWTYFQAPAGKRSVEILREEWPSLTWHDSPGRGRFQLYTTSTTYTLAYVLKAHESYAGEQYGGASAEAYMHLGELGRNGNGLPADHLASLTDAPLSLRTDYDAEEIRRLRKEAEAAEEKAREAESALSPFGKYDN